MHSSSVKKASGLAVIPEPGNNLPGVLWCSNPLLFSQPTHQWERCRDKIKNGIEPEWGSQKVRKIQDHSLDPRRTI
jgi:hypothetical protein